jgi:hypothetical protein
VLRVANSNVRLKRREHCLVYLVLSAIRNKYIAVLDSRNMEVKFDFAVAVDVLIPAT